VSQRGPTADPSAAAKRLELRMVPSWHRPCRAPPVEPFRRLGRGFMRVTTAQPEDNRRFVQALRELL